MAVLHALINQSLQWIWVRPYWLSVAADFKMLNERLIIEQSWHYSRVILVNLGAYVIPRMPYFVCQMLRAMKNHQHLNKKHDHSLIYCEGY